MKENPVLEGFPDQVPDLHNDGTRVPHLVRREQ
jgi:hypothetical protein